MMQFYCLKQQYSDIANRFDFDGSNITALTDAQGNPWFVAKEVCGIFGLKHTGMVIKRLGDNEKSYVKRTYLGLRPGKKMVIVNESGLYKLVMKSNKPEAVRFQNWIATDVLPQIRKTGQYKGPDPAAVKEYRGSNPHYSAKSYLVKSEVGLRAGKGIPALKV